MKKRILTGLLLSMMAGILFTGTTSYAKTASDEIAMGVYVEEVNVSGMKKEEAKAHQKTFCRHEEHAHPRGSRFPSAGCRSGIPALRRFSDFRSP